MAGRKITVIGSINMDLVTSTNQIPKVGETVLGHSFIPYRVERVRIKRLLQLGLVQM